ncbi:MAG TPA: tetratricopeptide repeat protein, partial [Pyrinomonadaceae bacterium]|nr:tetratricopeptide repeat protein [Pyrinomonadaceae bacterium]
CEKTPALARRIKHERVCARSLFILGMSHWYQYGDGDRATAFLEEGLNFYRKLNFDTGITLTLVVLAAIRQSKNDLAQAEILLDESLTAAERAENNLTLSIALVNYGRLKFAGGDFERAEDLCRRSLMLRGKILDRWGLVQCLAPLAAISVVKGDTPPPFCTERLTRCSNRSAHSRRRFSAPTLNRASPPPAPQSVKKTSQIHSPPVKNYRSKKLSNSLSQQISKQNLPLKFGNRKQFGV